LNLTGLVKKFGDLVAVDDLSLKIGRASSLPCLGPTRAGKTTTIKMITGLIKPTSGRTRICGFDVQTEPLEARQRLAYVPDFPFLYDKLTAGILRFTGEVFRIDARASKKSGRAGGAFSPGGIRPTAPSKVSLTARAMRHRHRLGLLHDPEYLSLTSPWWVWIRNMPGGKRRAQERRLSGVTVLVSPTSSALPKIWRNRIGILLGGG